MQFTFPNMQISLSSFLGIFPCYFSFPNINIYDYVLYQCFLLSTCPQCNIGSTSPQVVRIGYSNKLQSFSTPLFFARFVQKPDWILQQGKVCRLVWSTDLQIDHKIGCKNYKIFCLILIKKLLKQPKS